MSEDRSLSAGLDVDLDRILNLLDSNKEFAVSLAEAFPDFFETLVLDSNDCIAAGALKGRILLKPSPRVVEWFAAVWAEKINVQ